MEITKFKASEVAFHIRHDLRDLPDGKTDYGNESIDTSLTENNYSLIDRGNNAAEVNEYRKNLEKEIFHYARKNYVHSVEVVIQCPADCPVEQKEAFFRESFNYICSRLPMGEKCVFVAEVHTDEKHFSPSGEMISKDHLHIMYTPAVPDKKHEGYEYRLCADALTKRSELLSLHPGLQKHLDECGIHATVYQKKDSSGRRISLSVPELKALTKETGITFKKSLTYEELGNILVENENLKNKVSELTAKIEQFEREKTTSHEGSWGASTAWGRSSSWESSTEDKTW